MPGETTLVRGRHVILGVDGRGEAEVIGDGALLIKDGTILEVGNHRDLAERHQPARILGSDDHVVCPGFVNAHHHVGLTPLQLGSPDLPLELWIVRRLASRFVDPYLDTLYSAFELLESGVTTVQHLHGRTPRPVSRIVDTASDVIRAYEDIGMRVSYSYGLRDQNRIIYEDDETFVGRLPADLAGPARALLAEQTLDVSESLAVFDELHRKYLDHDRVTIQLAPVNLHWCSDTAIQRTVETARRHGVPMHMHLLETPLQKEYARRRTGGSAVSHLHRLGALGPDMTLGHGVWATEPDIELIADTGTCLCHNCSSNLRLRSGVAPINAYRRRGVRVALGIDEAGINDDRDMLQEMRLVLRMHRVPGLREEEVPSAAEVLGMATEGGGATTGFGRRIGRLSPGCAADLILFNWRRVTRPFLSDDVPVADALVQRARPSDIHAVLVAGEVVLQDGRFLRVDREAMLAELAARMRAAPTEVEQRNRHLGLALLEEARRFYDGYLAGERREPLYRLNSGT
ncbi:amidohydrolase family protein [Sabulicella rubraurantiaca]|uniref:amidohydrolase family protein n=1 Tax=Sabulicella rubraurantiaca TaxID=2811429 RepID=UPI001A97CBF9|nr:amidohydrolase family protein [Sabulicella rubraurantiaca]